MSQTAENMLYLGHNIELARTMLNLSCSVGAQVHCQLDHISSAEQLDATLTKKQYSQFICDLPLSKAQMEKINREFPLLKTTYLGAPDIEKLSTVMQGVISEEVKAALDYLSIPIYFKNIEGQFLACNHYFSHLLGMSPAQIIGKTAADLLPADLAKEIEQLDKKVFTHNKSYLHEATIPDLNGETYDVVFRKERIANSRIQIGIIFDVTEINAARSALEKERIMLRATANISKDLIFFKDLQGRFLGCNKQFEKFVGCPEQEILGKIDEQLFEFDQALMCQEQDRHVMDNNQVYAGEEYLTYYNGERHFIDMKKQALLDANGQVQGLIGVGRDITANLKLQKRLKIADTVFENSKECFLVTDDQGNIISANKALCSASGYLKRELLGQNITLFKSNKHNIIEAAFKENKSWQGDLSFINKSGKVSYAWLEAYVVEHPEDGIYNRIYSFINLNAAEDVEQKIQHLAKYDPLTGLYNRIALFARLEDAMTRAEFKEIAMAAVVIDINGFKEINEQYGHNVGDYVLKETAERLKNCVLEKDTVARFGNHEFIVIVDELASEQDAAIVARKVAQQFSYKYIVDDLEISISAAIGIAMCPDDGADIDALIESAEEAKQRAQGDSETSYHFYTNDLTSHSKQQFELERELGEALELQQFELYFQPQFNIRKQQIVAVEALLRWNHPQRGLLEADEFLSLAESSGLLVPISMLAIRMAAMQAASWHKSGIHFGRICVNISHLELEQIDFIGELQTILHDTKCSSKWLEFAIDETIFVSISPIVHDNLLNISKLGVALMVDNYAADRPALYLIGKLGIEKLKLARHFREGSTSSYFTGAAVMNALSTLGQSLGVDIVSDYNGEVNKQSVTNVDCAQWPQDTIMKASETTFYLRCHKRK